MVTKVVNTCTIKNKGFRNDSLLHTIVALEFTAADPAVLSFENSKRRIDTYFD